MSIKAIIEGKEVELKPDELKLGEGFALITPDSVPKGYFTQEALDNVVKDRLAKERDKVKSALQDDQEFHKSIFSKYNVTLGDDGKPKGLKPDFDPEEWKAQAAKQLTKPLQEEKEKLSTQLEKMKRGMVESHILKAANGLFQEQYIKSFTGDDDPFVVQKFAGMFDVDENGTVALKDPQGGFRPTGDGGKYTPEKFFEENKDKFADLLQDKRQRGSGFGDGGGGSVKFTPEQIKGMSDEEYAKNREAILKSAGE